MPTSPLRAQLLPVICTLLAELARTAVKAQSAMRLLATMTPWARKMLMPLPFCPVPPALAPMRATRLPVTMVPSSPSLQRWTRMPPLPQSSTVLSVIDSPVDSIARMPASSASRTVVRDNASAGAVERQAGAACCRRSCTLSMETLARLGEMHERPARIRRAALPAPSMTRSLQFDDLGARRPMIMWLPPPKTSRVAPGTPESRVRAGSFEIGDEVGAGRQEDLPVLVEARVEQLPGCRGSGPRLPSGRGRVRRH